jgi:Fur family ferric uptake transcriptional regulator
MTTATVEREAQHRLAEQGVRFTKGRRAVVAALADAQGPRTVAELADSLGPAVPVSSLYRTLTVFEEAGVAVPHYGAGGVTRYELAEWATGHHHHVVCAQCGAVDDLEIPPTLEARVEAVVADLAEYRGFEATGHTLEIEGRCGSCQ